MADFYTKFNHVFMEVLPWRLTLVPGAFSSPFLNLGRQAKGGWGYNVGVEVFG